MSESLGFFRWSRPVEGAQILRDARLLDGTTADVVLRVADRDQLFDPSEEPELLDALVILDTGDPGDVAAFGSAWGLLGVGGVSIVGRTGATPWVRPAERLDAWAAEVGELRDVFELWAAVATRDRATLREHLDVNAENAIYTGAAGSYSFPTRLPAGGKRTVSDRVRPFLERGDLVQVGRLLVQALVNERLRDLVTVQLVSDAAAGSLALRQMPKSLLALAWLRLAEAAAGSRSPRRCPRCMTWFLISETTRRGHGTYCSPKCRIAFHAKRQRARAMASEGASVGSIAKRLQVGAGFVREWIAEGRTKRPAKSRRKGA